MNAILSSVEFQMSLLLFVAFAGYLLASRINQSAVVGIILAGIAVGPSWLGLVTYTDFVSSLAHLGAVILLFVVGLHFKFRDIVNARNFVIALCGVVFPLVCGYYAAKLFGFSSAGAVFVGTALTATSIAITANVLKDIGRLQSPTARVIIGAAVIDDVLSLLALSALSVSGEIVEGKISLLLVMATSLKVIVFLVVGAAVGRLVVSYVMLKMDSSSIAQKYPEFVFIFAMMVVFFYSMVAELIGLSAIVGSFLAGVSLESVGLSRSKSFREGAEYLQVIFASVFFASLGVLVDLHAANGNLLTFLTVISLVAIFTKVVGCGIPAKLMGMSFKDSLTVGFGMAPRGEVAMIVALIGLSRGLILQSTYTTLVLMSLVTTLLTPMVLTKLMKARKEQTVLQIFF